MTNCINCGSLIPDGKKFCPECGQKVEMANPPAADCDMEQGEPIRGSYTIPSASTPKQKAAPPAAPAQPVPAAPPAPPIQTAQPVQPIQPAQPAPPIQTAQPAPPIQPAQPAPPIQAAQPVQPAQSAQPADASGGYQPQQSYVPPVQPVSATKDKKPLNKKLLLIIGGAALIVILAIILITSLGGKKDSPDNGPIADSGMLVDSTTDMQARWDGTWFGCLSVSEAGGDYADLVDHEFDVYMVVDVDRKGQGNFSIYLSGEDKALVTAACEGDELGLYALSGETAGQRELDATYWTFLPMPDYPDQYAMGDKLTDDDGSMYIYLYMKKWGGSWQDEIDSGFATVPPSVAWYEDAIASGQTPPVGFVPVN